MSAVTVGRVRDWWASAESVEYVWALSDHSRRCYLGSLVLTAWMAGAMFTSSDPRLASPAFAVLLQTGGCGLWGAVFTVLAAGLLVGRAVGTRALQGALVATAVVFALWALSFADAALRNPAASLTGTPMYAAAAYWNLSQALAYRDRRRRREVVGP